MLLTFLEVFLSILQEEALTALVEGVIRIPSNSCFAVSLLKTIVKTAKACHLIALKLDEILQNEQ